MPIRNDPLPGPTRTKLRKLARARDYADEAAARRHAAVDAACVQAHREGGGLADIGEEVGLTKARVHQIVKAAREC